MSPSSPVRVACVNDYEVVVTGLAHMLRRYSDRVEVVDLDPDTTVAEPVHVALYDTFGQAQGQAADLERLLGNPLIETVAVYTWNFQANLVRGSLAKGAKGYLSKALPAAVLVEMLEQVSGGETIVTTAPGTASIVGEWPGREEGLTPRESEVIALITQGMSNNAIADQTHLSINSVKSYIRTGYRKIGVASRSKAVLWGVRHGFDVDPRRTTGARLRPAGAATPGGSSIPRRIRPSGSSAHPRG